MVRERAFRVDVPNERHLMFEMDGFEPVLRTLMKRKWVVMVPPKDSAGFVTCDHPVCLMFSDPKMRRGLYPPGHGLTKTEIVFPVSSRMALVGAFEIERETTVELTEDGVAGVNGALVAFADKQVFAAEQDFSYSRQYNERPHRGISLLNDPLFTAPDEG
jgi:hypothetical protein